MFSELVFPKGDLRMIEHDPTDDMVLETAMLGKADRIFTGDKHLLELDRYKGVGIKKAKDL